MFFPFLFTFTVNVIHGLPVGKEQVLYKMAVSLDESVGFETPKNEPFLHGEANLTLVKQNNESEVYDNGTMGTEMTDNYKLSTGTNQTDNLSTEATTLLPFTRNLVEEMGNYSELQDYLLNPTSEGNTNSFTVDKSQTTVTSIQNGTFDDDDLQETTFSVASLTETANFTTVEPDILLNNSEDGKYETEIFETSNFTISTINDSKTFGTENKFPHFQNTTYYLITGRQPEASTINTKLQIDFLSTNIPFINCTEENNYKTITNEFTAHINSQGKIPNITLFQSYLRSYFPESACDLFITTFSEDTVKWTDRSLNKSELCSSKQRPPMLKLVTNGVDVSPEFHRNFLPDFDVFFVNWTSKVDCVEARRYDPAIVVLDVVVYVMGSILLIGVVTVVVVFFRGKTKKNHTIDTNLTPNSYQKYTLRGRRPVFMSPEVDRSNMAAISNPAFIDDETIEPRAKHFIEN